MLFSYQAPPRTRRRWLVTAVAAAGLVATALAAGPTAAEQATPRAVGGEPTTYTPPEPADLSSLGWVEAFDALHAKMQREYAFTAWKGIDWAGLGATYRPQVQAAQDAGDQAAYYLALRAYTHQMHDGHVSITDDPAVEAALAGGGFGLVVARLDGGDVVAVWVDPNGPAFAAGISLGDRIVRWDGRPVDEALRRTSTVLAPAQPTTARVRYERLRYLVRAPVGATRSVTLRSPGSGAGRTVELTAAEDGLLTLHLTDSRSMLTQHGIPEDFVQDRILPGNVGYVRILAEIDLPAGLPGDPTPTLTQFRQAIRSFNRADVDGIVVDIRGNSGGSDQMVADLMSSFYATKSFYEYQNYIVPDTGQFEIWVGDDETGQYIDPNRGIHIEPGTPRYRGPVVALVDNACISSCEGVAMGIKRLPQGRVVGFHGTNGSFGMAGDGVLMPGGYAVRWPFGQSLDVHKVVQIDSRGGRGGILPDVRIPSTLGTVSRSLSGGDVGLRYALRALRQMRG